MKARLFLSCMAMASIAMVGCKPISGILEVNEPVTVKITELVQDDDPFCRINPEEECTWREVKKNLKLNVGKMKAKLDTKSKTKIDLILDDLKGDPIVQFKVPSGFKVPERRGEFKLTSQQIGQPFDLHGLVDTEVTESKRYDEWERCTYQEQRTVCSYVPPRCRTTRRGETVCSGGGQQCHIETVTVWGNRRVEFYYRQTDTDVIFSLMQPSQSDIAAQFTGRQSYSDKIYIYQGICR